MTESRDESVDPSGDGAGARDHTAEGRDHASDADDKASTLRDERADARDERAELRDAESGRVDDGAAADRASARQDRQGGARDRRRAERDREAASADRDHSALERATFLVDELTGARRRDAGVSELEREAARANRTGQPFVLAFIDVDALKATNDSAGHAAGDDLLCQVVCSVRAHVRPYDVIVRYGGDEFLCGLLGVTIAQAADRLAAVNAELSSRGASVTAGLAALEVDEPLENLIKRADDALYHDRREQRTAD
jgi:diguanylate cyclase (GGDEF)-like protein